MNVKTLIELLMRAQLSALVVVVDENGDEIDIDDVIVAVPGLVQITLAPLCWSDAA